MDWMQGFLSAGSSENKKPRGEPRGLIKNSLLRPDHYKESTAIESARNFF
jgi:hypothetical protein